MNKLLILLYATIAIFAAGFAKAETTSNQAGVIAKDLEATFDQAKVEFLVSGESANDCSERVILAEQAGDQIVFKVINTVSLDFYCTQRVSNFVKTIPIRTVVQIANLEIEPNTEYTLTVVGSPLSVKVPGSELRF